MMAGGVGGGLLLGEKGGGRKRGNDERAGSFHQPTPAIGGEEEQQQQQQRLGLHANLDRLLQVERLVKRRLINFDCIQRLYQQQHLEKENQPSTVAHRSVLSAMTCATPVPKGRKNAHDKHGCRRLKNKTPNGCDAARKESHTRVASPPSFLWFNVVRLNRLSDAITFTDDDESEEEGDEDAKGAEKGKGCLREERQRSTEVEEECEHDGDDSPRVVQQIRARKFTRLGLSLARILCIPCEFELSFSPPPPLFFSYFSSSMLYSRFLSFLFFLTRQPIYSQSIFYSHSALLTPSSLRVLSLTVDLVKTNDS